jgi:hypothetical protein
MQERVTYVLAVPATPMKQQQLRAPEHNGFAPFMEIFPGTKRFLVSPVFLKRAAEAHRRVREVVRAQGLGCYKNSGEDANVPPLYLATLLSLHICESVSLYGVTVGGGRQQGSPSKVSGALRRLSEDSGLEWSCRLAVAEGGPEHGYAAHSDASSREQTNERHRE